MTRDTVTESERGARARALTLLREWWRLYRLVSLDVEFDDSGDAAAWDAVTHEVRTLLAEESPGRALPGEVER